VGTVCPLPASLPSTLNTLSLAKMARSLVSKLRLHGQSCRPAAKLQNLTSLYVLECQSSLMNLHGLLHLSWRML